MSYTAGPIQLAAGVTVTQSNPASNSGNLSSQAAVVVNLSPFELIISSGAGNVIAVVDPFTRDLIPLDPEAGQQLIIDPLALGVLIAPTSLAQCFVTWYQAGEKVPGNYPSPIAVSAGPYSAQLALNFLIAGATDIFSAVSQPSVFRSANITLSNLTAVASVVTVQVTTGISITVLASYTVVFAAALGTANLRIPLTPVGGLATMNLSIQIASPTASVTATILLDTAPVDPPPITTYASSYASSYHRTVAAWPFTGNGVFATVGGNGIRLYDATLVNTSASGVASRVAVSSSGFIVLGVTATLEQVDHFTSSGGLFLAAGDSFAAAIAGASSWLMSASYDAL